MQKNTGKYAYGRRLYAVRTTPKLPKIRRTMPYETGKYAYETAKYAYATGKYAYH